MTCSSEEEGEELHPAVSLFIHPSHPKERVGVVILRVVRWKEEIGVNEHELFCPSLLEISIV